MTIYTPDTWAEEEARICYPVGWRHWETEDWYEARKSKDIEYYSTKVFAKEPDAAELIAKFKAAWEEAHIELQWSEDY
jgi:hypothetical protein